MKFHPSLRNLAEPQDPLHYNRQSCLESVSRDIAAQAGSMHAGEVQPLGGKPEGEDPRISHEQAENSHGQRQDIGNVIPLRLDYPAKPAPLGEIQCEEALGGPAVERLHHHYAPGCRNANPNRITGQVRPERETLLHQD